MEGGVENSLYEILQNSPNFWLQSTPSLTAIDSLLSVQDCNFSHNQLLNPVTNHPPPLFRPTGVFGFLAGGSTTNNVGVVSEFTTYPQDQTAEFIKELFLRDNENLNSTLHKSLGGVKQTKKGSSSTWYKGHWKSDEDR